MKVGVDAGPTLDDLIENIGEDEGKRFGSIEDLDDLLEDGSSFSYNPTGQRPSGDGDVDARRSQGISMSEVFAAAEEFAFLGEQEVDREKFVQGFMSKCDSQRAKRLEPSLRDFARSQAFEDLLEAVRAVQKLDEGETNSGGDSTGVSIRGLRRIQQEGGGQGVDSISSGVDALTEEVKSDEARLRGSESREEEAVEADDFDADGYQKGEFVMLNEEDLGLPAASLEGGKVMLEATDWQLLRNNAGEPPTC